MEVVDYFCKLLLWKPFTYKAFKSICLCSISHASNFIVIPQIGCMPSCILIFNLSIYFLLQAAPIAILPVLEGQFKCYSLYPIQ